MAAYLKSVTMDISKNTSDSPPSYVSIIIPVLNGGQYFGRCLDSVFNINYPKGFFEVVVVDNGSKDNTLEIAKKYDTKILIEPKKNISSLRNCGAKYSKGEILAFLDSDCMVPRNWIMNAIPYFKDDKVAMVGSLCKITEECTWVGEVWDICLSSLGKRRLKGKTDRLGSGNMIVRRKCFEEVQGFDDHLVTGEDDDVCFRLNKCNYIIYSDPDIAACHFGEDRKLATFFRKEIWRGYETFTLFLKNKGRMNQKVVAYSFFYLTGLLFIALSPFYLPLFRKGYVLLFFSIGLMFSLPFGLAVITASRSRKWRYLFHFALLYLTFGVARAISIFRIKTNMRKRSL